MSETPKWAVRWQGVLLSPAAIRQLEAEAAMAGPRPTGYSGDGDAMRWQYPLTQTTVLAPVKVETITVEQARKVYP